MLYAAGQMIFVEKCLFSLYLIICWCHPTFPSSLSTPTPSLLPCCPPIMQSLKEVKERVEGGYRMEAPEDCPSCRLLPNDRLLGAGAAQETCFPQAEGETGADDGGPQPGPRGRASGRGPVWLWMLILVLQWWRDTWDANPLIVHHTDRSSEMFLCTRQSNWIPLDMTRQWFGFDVMPENIL